MILSQWTKLVFWVRECPIVTYCHVYQREHKTSFLVPFFQVFTRWGWPENPAERYMCGCSDPVYSCVGSSVRVRHQALSSTIHSVQVMMIWLVVWNMNGLFSIINHPNWISYFSEGLKPPTSDDDDDDDDDIRGGMIVKMRFVDEAWWHKKNASVYRLIMIYIYNISRSINNFE